MGGRKFFFFFFGKLCTINENSNGSRNSCDWCQRVTPSTLFLQPQKARTLCKLWVIDLRPTSIHWSRVGVPVPRVLKRHPNVRWVGELLRSIISNSGLIYSRREVFSVGGKSLKVRRPSMSAYLPRSVCLRPGAPDEARGPAGRVVSRVTKCPVSVKLFRLSDWTNYSRQRRAFGYRERVRRGLETTPSPGLEKSHGLPKDRN